jgi:hypothetical protein
MTNTGITMDKGYVKIADTVKIRGTSETTPEAQTALTFSSRGLLSILSGATLELYPDTVFNYSPNIAGDGGVASVQKRHLVMADPSSMMVLHKATINTGTTGLALDRGKLFVNDVVNLKTSYTAGAEFELGSAANLSIMQSSVFNVDGLLKYVATTYP